MNYLMYLIRWLALQIKKLLPEGTEIIEDYHHPLLPWSGTFIILKLVVIVIV